MNHLDLLSRAEVFAAVAAVAGLSGDAPTARCDAGRALGAGARRASRVPASRELTGIA